MSDLSQIIQELKKVSNLRNDANSLLSTASDLRNEYSSSLENALKRLKENVDSEYKMTQNQLEKIIINLERSLTKDKHAIIKEREALEKETQANTNEDNILNLLNSFSEERQNQVPQDNKETVSIDEKTLRNNLKEYIDSCRKRDAASQERDKKSRMRDEKSRMRDEDSKKRYEEVKGVFDCQKNSNFLKEHKKKYFTKKRTHCYGFLGMLTIVWLYFAGNLLGFPLGIDIGSSDTPKYVVLIVLLCIVLIFILCIIIVLSRRLHRINKALLKIDALIMRMELSTDRDLGKPYRLDRELEMIYRILES